MLIFREMLYDMSLCPENQGRVMERRPDMESKSNSFLAKEPIPSEHGDNPAVPYKVDRAQDKAEDHCKKDCIS